MSQQIMDLQNPLLLPLDHQQLRDHKSRCIWLRRRYMFWEHIFHYEVRKDYSH